MANYKLTERTRKTKDGKEIKTQCIIADFENMTKNEREAVEMYVKMGYKLFPKKDRKGIKGNGMTKNEFLFYLEREEKAIFDKTDIKESFMILKKNVRIALFGEKDKEATKKFKALESRIKQYAEDNAEEFEKYDKEHTKK